ncbi:MAG: DUF504 domain-containing protein [Candidatus Aenigmarchaeota archaeon]|nr:DUF504 domain-containing protein [Candidatus Aenigmarchaeota archaeon]
MAYETLNRLKWSGELGKCSVIIRSRGSQSDEKVIDGAEIGEIKKTYFTYSHYERETVIPNHRILRITKEGKTLWMKKTKKG